MFFEIIFLSNKFIRKNSNNETRCKCEANIDTRGFATALSVTKTKDEMIKYCIIVL